MKGNSQSKRQRYFSLKKQNKLAYNITRKTPESRIQQPGSVHLYISSCFECSPPLVLYILLLHEIYPRKPKQILYKTHSYS